MQPTTTSHVTQAEKDRIQKEKEEEEARIAAEEEAARVAEERKFNEAHDDALRQFFRCADYTKYQEEGPKKGECAADECKERQKVMIKGKCEDCPEYSITDPNDNTKCLEDYCGLGELVTRDGVCLRCIQYTRPAEDGKSCVKDPCGER